MDGKWEENIFIGDVDRGTIDEESVRETEVIPTTRSRWCPGILRDVPRKFFTGKEFCEVKVEDPLKVLYDESKHIFP